MIRDLLGRLVASVLWRVAGRPDTFEEWLADEAPRPRGDQAGAPAAAPVGPGEALAAELRVARLRVAVLEEAVLLANAALNTLPWAGDGLTQLVHDGHASGPVVSAIYACASALDAEPLGLLGREVPGS